MMLNILLVAIGGAIGSVLRYGVGLATLRLTVVGGFPWGTFLVNIGGSLLIGLIAGALANVTQWSQELRLLVVVGVLGGFTTFSAFSLDSLLLLEKGQYAMSVCYVAGSVGLSLAATATGLWLVRVMTP